MIPIDPKYGIKTWVDNDGNPQAQIVKIRTGEPIPPDEPLILFRARDRLALTGALYPYQTACIADGCVPEHLDGIRNRINAFNKFKIEQSERMKQPGITRGL